MTHFIRNGNTYRVSSTDAIDIKPLLPAGNYIVKVDSQGNLFLEQMDEFTTPSKVYGTSTAQRDRIFNTFLERPMSTGVLLTGEKGSGKTMLSKNLCILAAEQGIPTIVVNQPMCGDAFNSLIQSIEQPAVVLFDEFEKVYDSEQQESLLTLLDGVYPSKKLFLLTCNDKWRIDSHMRNRPGRIFYMLDFKGLAHDFIVEYCNDNLHNLDNLHGVTVVASCFNQFNFDMLKSLVEEMNRYNESASDAMVMLNANPEFSEDAEYTVKVETANGLVYEKEQLGTPVLFCNPLTTDQLCVWYMTKPQRATTGPTPKPKNSLRVLNSIGFDDYDDMDGSNNRKIIKFTGKHLKNIDPGKGVFMFIDDTGNRLHLSRLKETYSYHSHFSSGDPRV